VTARSTILDLDDVVGCELWATQVVIPGTRCQRDDAVQLCQDIGCKVQLRCVHQDALGELAYHDCLHARTPPDGGQTLSSTGHDIAIRGQASQPEERD
jgi:hypothetical protein